MGHNRRSRGGAGSARKSRCVTLPKKRRKAPAFRHGDISRALAVVFVLDIRLGPVIYFNHGRVQIEQQCGVQQQVPCGLDTEILVASGHVETLNDCGQCVSLAKVSNAG